MNAAIVLTTINQGEIISNLKENLLTHKTADHTTIYAIPDKKTPAAFYKVCAEARDEGLKIVSPDVNEQTAFLETFPVCPQIPFNSDNRRNVGFLMALRDHADFVLSLDDDNFFEKSENAIGAHLARLAPETADEQLTRSSAGFWNCCSLLHFNQQTTPLFPRGYPLKPRFIPAETGMTPGGGVPTWINAGLWLEAPDVDAMTWLCFGEQARGYSWTGTNHRLALDTWCPINTQNTAIHSALMPAYYYLPMSSPDLEVPIDRYGDILSGYFALKIARSMGATVSFGAPVAHHRRNSHDYHRDYLLEMLMLSVMDEFLDWLIPLKLSGNSVCDLYLDLARQFDAQAQSFKGKSWTAGLRKHVRLMADSMTRWISAVRHAESI